jgi:hypothetical protein
MGKLAMCDPRKISIDQCKNITGSIKDGSSIESLERIYSEEKVDCDGAFAVSPTIIAACFQIVAEKGTVLVDGAEICYNICDNVFWGGLCVYIMCCLLSIMSVLVSAKESAHACVYNSQPRLALAETCSTVCLFATSWRLRGLGRLFKTRSSGEESTTTHSHC